MIRRDGRFRRRRRPGLNDELSARARCDELRASGKRGVAANRVWPDPGRVDAAALVEVAIGHREGEVEGAVAGDLGSGLSDVGPGQVNVQGDEFVRRKSGPMDRDRGLWRAGRWA